MNDDDAMEDARYVRARQIEQGELWEDLRVEHQWFHIVRGMILRGKLAEMGANAWAVYCVLKAHTDPFSGEARPGIPRIAELIGASHDTVQRALDRLRDLGVIEVEKRGRSNRYKLREEIALTTHTGDIRGVAERIYQPKVFKAFVEELERFAHTGNLPTDGKITINLTLNVQNITQGDNGSVVMNVQTVQAETVTDEKKINRKLRKLG